MRNFFCIALKSKPNILLLFFFLFGYVLQTAANVGRCAATEADKAIPPSDRYEKFLDSKEKNTTLGDIHRKKAVKIRTRFCAAPFFTLTPHQQATTPCFSNDRMIISFPPSWKDDQSQPFYYVFLFRLTPF